MMMEDNEYGQSVTLAAVPVSAFKCVLSLSVSGLSISCCCLPHRTVCSMYFSCTLAMAKACEPTSVTDTNDKILLNGGFKHAISMQI